MSRTQVVVTGVGAVSAAGIGYRALGEALALGRSCGSPFDSPLPVAQVGAVPDAVAELVDFPDDRKAALAMLALDEAMADAGFESGRAPAGLRTAVFLGTGLSSVTPGELHEDVYPHIDGERFDRVAMGRDLAPDRAAPRRHRPERVSDAVARRVGAKGPVGTSFSACAAAAQAIAEGFWAVRRGEVDLAVVGGHDSMVHPLGMLSFVTLGAVSPEGCRPFDRHRDGFMLGEGAAVLVLMGEDLARRSGARIRGRILGAATSVDAHNVTAPHPDGAGAERVMRGALADAGLSPDRVDYVNAHGTGTPVGDVAESRAIERVLGHVPVSSVKGSLGHTIAAAGAIEAAVCLAALEGGWLPGTAGLSEPDPACPVQALIRPTEYEARVMLSNSFGFGGQNACLAVGRA